VSLALVATVFAYALVVRRDVGAGLLPDRPGPARAAPGLRSPLALAWRLHRGPLLGWAIGFALLGIVFGGVATSVGDMARDSRAFADIVARVGGTAGVVDSDLAGSAGILGLIAAAYAIQATLKLRDEETGGHAEPVLSTATGRLRWAGSHLLFTFLGPAAALAAGGLAMGIAYGLAAHDVGGQVPRLLAGAMAQLPAVWVLAAIAVALFGTLPRLSAIGWGALVACLLLFLVGGAVRLDQWVLDISPYTHLPHLPGGQVTVAPLAVLTVVAAALAAAGLAGLRRRDIPTP
jgi:ABC-2 type transport system permease protein